MKRKNANRTALFTSIISLLLCVSMMVGTTFAWFSDSVATGMNTIAAGNLDVELLANGQKVSSSTKLFDDVTLWEPGVVVYENLQIANVGTMALKYQMSLTFGSENDLNGHKLSEVLQVAVLNETVDAGTMTREQVLEKAMASSQTGALSDFYLSGELEANTSAPAFAVVVFWAPNDNATDNLYNVNNGQTTSDDQPLHIEFGVKLVAEQKMHESDSFGDDYDENVSGPNVLKVANAEELMAALSSITEPTEIDATGVELDVTEQNFYLSGGLTLKGATITTTSRGGTYLIAEAGTGDTITFQSCTFKRGETGANIIAAEAEGANLVFNNCAFEGPLMPNMVDKPEGTTTFNNCTFKITKDAMIYSGYVNCMGGTHTFNKCAFDFTGGSTMGSNQYVKWNAVNSYSENYSTNVVLNECTFTNCGTQKYGGNSTLTIN